MADRIESGKPKPRHHVWIWVVVGLALAGALVWILMPYKIQTNSAGRHAAGNGSAVPVVAAVAQQGNIDITDQALGTVTPLANITVRTQINGQLMQIAFKEGQLVKEGDFLAQVDPRPYELSLEQAEGALVRDTALLKDAQLNLERYKKLVAQDSLAKQQLDTQQSLVDQYKGAVITDQGQIDTAKLNLTYCHITAPVTGRVGIRQVDQGNYVQVSDANGIVTITELQPITVIFTLPEDNLPAIMKRLNAGAELVVNAFDRTQSTKLATGKLVSVDNQIDTTTGTIKLRAQFDNNDSVLFPNQFVNIQLIVDTLKDAIVIPSAGVQRGAPGTFVYLVKDDNTVTIKAVKLGPTENDSVAIIDGLSVGDKVVIDGTDKLRDGSKITLPNEKNSDGKSSDGKSSDKDSSTDASPDKDAKGDDASEHRHHKDQQ